MSKGGILMALLEGVAGVIGYFAGELFKEGVFKATGVEDEEQFVAKIDHKDTPQLEDKEAKHETKPKNTNKSAR